MSKEAPPTSGFIKAPYEPAMINLIKQHFPNLKINDLQIKVTGTEGIVATLNDDLIIKAPKPSRGLEGIQMEYRTSEFLRKNGISVVPDIHIVNGVLPFIWYKKIHGISLRSLANTLSEKEMDSIATDLTEIMCRFHAISLKDVHAEGLTFSPSWHYSRRHLKPELRAHLPKELHPFYDDVSSRLDEILSCPKECEVLGHFDLHGSNIFLKEDNRTITGIIDLGNVAIGDYHNDLSKMNMSSVPLAEKIIGRYERISGHKVDRNRVRLFSSAYMLSIVLSKLPNPKDPENYESWLNHLLKWSRYAKGDALAFSAQNKKKAQSMPQKQKITDRIPFEWRKWVAKSILQGVPEKDIKSGMVANGISPAAADREIGKAKQHPYVAACKEIKAALGK